MNAAAFPEIAPARPIWLVTLADLALLLLGFFVLVAANQGVSRRALAEGLRRGFGGSATPSAPSPPAVPAAQAPMPLAAAAMFGFATASARVPEQPAALISWAREAARDPRVQVRVIGFTDTTAKDVDAPTGSAALLASDRARTVIVALVGAHVIEPGRVTIATAAAPGRRGVALTVGFAGNRQDFAGRQCRLAACAAGTDSGGKR